MWPGSLQYIATKLAELLSGTGTIPVTVSGGGGSSIVTGAAGAALALDATLTGGTQMTGIGAPSATTAPWTKARYGIATVSGAPSTIPAPISILYSQVIKVGPGKLNAVFISNKSAGGLWLGITDTASALVGGNVPDWDIAVANAQGVRSFDGGLTGFPFVDGCCLTLSSSQQNVVAATTLTGVTMTVLFK